MRRASGEHLTYCAWNGSDTAPGREIRSSSAVWRERRCRWRCARYRANVRTGVVGAVEEHPIRRYVSEGLLVTVNTDDPKLFGNSLAEEYRLLQDRLGFTSEELQALTLNGIRASWLSEPRKDALLAGFQAAFAIAQARPL